MRSRIYATTSPTLTDHVPIHGDDGHPTHPAIVVVHHGTFEPVLRRFAALRRRDETAEAFQMPTGANVESLSLLLTDVGAGTGVPVLHLVGDLDESTKGRTKQRDHDVLERATLLHEAMRERYPLVDDRIWLVLRAGATVSDEELDLVATFVAPDPTLPVAGAILITSSSGASLDHTPSDVDCEVADVLHLLTNAEVGAQLTEVGERAWAVGVGSVAYRPERILNAGILAIEDVFERLTQSRPRDPGYDEGRRWILELAIGPPRPGEERGDDEEALLTTGPGSGLLMATPGQRVRELASDLEGIDPGLWAGYISAAVDVASAPWTEPRSPKSPLVIAFGHVDDNLARRTTELRSLLEEAARVHFEDQQAIPSTIAWCEGVRAGLEESIAELGATRESLEYDDLRREYSDLAKSGRWLPYSTSTLGRSLLVVVMMLVIGYTFAPVASSVAWIFSKRLVWLGDGLAQNARMWSRVTAVSVGCLLWLLWEMKWRRVRRLRRSYIAAADRQLRALVLTRLIEGRTVLLRNLVTLVGADPSTPASLRRWLATGEQALLAAVEGARSDEDDGAALAGGRWAVSLPASGELSKTFSSLTPEARSVLVEAPLLSVRNAPLDCDLDALSEEIRSRLRRVLPFTNEDLHARWNSPEEVGPEAIEALSAPLWAGLPADLAERRGSARKQYLVSRSQTASVVQAVVSTFDDLVACDDPCFVANLWVTTLVLRQGGPSGKVGRKR